MIFYCTYKSPREVFTSLSESRAFICEVFMKYCVQKVMLLSLKEVAGVHDDGAVILFQHKAVCCR